MAAKITAEASFLSSSEGGVMPLFGLMLIPILFVAGIAVDVGRMVQVRSILSAAADSAVLAAGRALLDGKSDVTVKSTAVSYFNANVASSAGAGTVGTVTVDIDIDHTTGLVEVSASSRLPLTLTKVAGFDEVLIAAKAASKFDQRDIELAMVLDITGSMGQPMSKIADLKTAAKDLIDILLPDEGRPNKVRVGLAPYATSVNAGSNASLVTGGASSGNTCVYERSGAEAFTDAPPASTQYFGTAKSLDCPTASLAPLTDDKTVLKAKIDTYQPNGWTAGHLGAAWGWYLVSPNWSSIWPAASEPVAYGDAKTLKAVLLMTDGEFNKWYVSANGDSVAQAKSVCDGMKAAGVTVYTVAFMSPPEAESLLQTCASSSKHFFSAASGSALRSAFQEVAKDLGRLRLTH